MASLSAQQQHELALSAAYEDDTPTPLGWRRKLIPHIGKGLVPARTDIIFIAPNGEEFKTKAQLQRYLKSHKGSPSLSEFIWITDETPRRSSRSASKRSKSPPKSASKKKAGAEAPLEELKATKRRHTGNEEDAEAAKGDKKKRRKDTSDECTTGNIEGSPTWSSAKDSKHTPLKATKEKKNAKASMQSPEVSRKTHAGENGTHAGENGMEGQECKKHENGEETMKENEKGEEQAMEEPISYETMKDAKSEHVHVEEQEEAVKEESRKTENIQFEDKAVDNGHDDARRDKDLDNGHDDARMDDPEGSKDGTTMSLLGSDFSTDGMEAESDMFESAKKESPLAEGAIHHADKDQSENTLEDSEKDTMMCAENGLSEAVK